jgi:hypothetical protein
MLKSYDIFISYVAEDREVVEELYEKLTNNGLRVWYAKNELQVGQRIRPLIDRGLESSRYGIALISPRYNSHWTLGELFVLSKDKYRLLPVLYEISIEEVSLVNPELVTVYCLTLESGVEVVVKKVLEKVKPKPFVYYVMAKMTERIKKKWFLLVFGAISIALFLIAFFTYLSIKPSDKAIETSIKLRANALQRYVQNRQSQNIIQFNGEVATLNHINQLLRNQFTNKKIIHHNNKVQYYNGNETLTSLNALVKARLFDAGSKMEAPFGLLDYQALIYASKENVDWDVLSYSFYNLSPVHFKVVNTRLSFEGKYEIEVEYSNPIRYVEVNVNIDADIQSRQKNIQFFGFKKHEKMVFEKRGKQWHLSSIL